MKLSIAVISICCAAPVPFASAAPTASHLQTTDGLPLNQAVSHVRSVSSARLAPTQEQEGRRQLATCVFANGTSGTKCVGINACFGILDVSKIECGSCNGNLSCENTFLPALDKVIIGENSCNGQRACGTFVSNYHGDTTVGKGSW